jgi:hypothetical protein
LPNHTCTRRSRFFYCLNNSFKGIGLRIKAS